MVIFLNKKFCIINIFLTFACSFIVHGMYHWFPNVITSIFPVNESLFEHMKLIFLSPIISSTILYFIFKINGHLINNILFGLVISTIFNIVIFYLVYLPLYYAIGHSLILTLSIYFITIILSQYLYFLIIEMNNSQKLNTISLVMLIIITFILTYFTYHPLKIDFFKNSEDNTYGISK